MNLTMTNMDSKDDQARTKKIKLNEFTVWGGIWSYKSITVGYKSNFDCYSILSLFFWFFPHGMSLTLYSSLRTILILHLLIIWALIWVHVPSGTLFGFLWVVIAKTALFRGLLHINAARRVAVVHLMQW